MTASRATGLDAAPVEKFKPTSGMLPGYLGLFAVAFGVGYVALRVHTATGLSVALGLLFFGMLVWATQLRSRATVYPEVLRLKNAVIDYVIPLRLVEEVGTGTTLKVWAAGRRYVCVGIGKSLKSTVKQMRSTTRPIGVSRLQDYAEAANRANLDERATSYENFVVMRIEELVEQAKKRTADASTPERVQRVFAWPELAAMVVTGVAFLASLIV